MPADARQQARQITDLLIDYDSDDEVHARDDTSPQAPSKDSHKRRERRATQVELRMQFLKRVHGSLPVFNDDAPDPGCAYEYVRYSLAGSQHGDEEQLTLEMASQTDPAHPTVRHLLEQAREAHWRLTAPKGFAALKAQAELQQLLAYTAADVAHYASAKADPHSRLGSFPFEGDVLRELIHGQEQTFGLDFTRGLSDGSSLIGQLCPALRLCLAAEVATGLICDSQPPPPDTPQHASALLLFLAAALRQAEQECVKPVRWPPGSLWAVNPDLGSLKTLIDFHTILDPVKGLMAVLRSGAALSSSSSSSISGAEDSAEGQVPAATSPVMAALEVAHFLISAAEEEEAGQEVDEDQQQQRAQQQEQLGRHVGPARTCSRPCGGQGSKDHAAAATTAAAAAAAKILDLSSLLQLPLAAAASAAASNSNGQQQPQATAESPFIALVVESITALIDRCFDAHGQMSAAPGSSSSSSGGDATSSDININSSSSSSTTNTTNAAAASAALGVAADVAHAVAAVTGGLALKLFWEALDAAGLVAMAAADGAQPQGFLPQGFRSSAAEQQDPAALPSRLQQFAVVQAALLLAEIEGLYRAAGEVLQSAVAQWASHLQEHQQHSQHAANVQGTMLQQQGTMLQQGRQLGPRSQHSTSQPCTSCAGSAYKQAAKLQITVQVLRLVQLAHNISDTVRDMQAAAKTPAASALSSTSSTSSTSSSASSSTSSRSSMTSEGDLPAAVAAALENLPKQDATLLMLARKVRSQLPELDGQPDKWFAGAFSTLQQQQLSPLCLHPAVCLQQQQRTHPAGHASAAAAAAAAALAGDAKELDYLEYSQIVFTMLSEDVGQQFVHAWQASQNQHTSWQQQQGQTWGIHSVSNSSNGSSSSSSRGLAARLQALAAAAAASTDPSNLALADRVEALANTGLLSGLLQLLQPLLVWQRYWTEATVWDNKVASNAEDGLLVRLGRSRQQDKKGDAAAAAHLKAQRATPSGGGKGSSKAKKQGSKQTDLREAAASGSSQPTRPTSSKASRPESRSEPSDDDMQWCRHCLVEAAAAADGVDDAATAARDSNNTNADEVSGTSSSSSSSSSTSGGHPGLYSRFPVSWADPCMMRRLLWDLLGKIKPTAQAWFREHLGMCPHSTCEFFWHFVVASIARHIWAPPGQWDASSVSQMALLLPLEFRAVRQEESPASSLARANYAQELNVCCAQQGADAQVAALLSLQVLLALDPHAARAQPKPELLYYTPSGFHAAVCKTLMQALQPSSTAGTQKQQASSAQQQQQDGTGKEAQPEFEPMFWSQAPLPVWYVWWHIGLLDYHHQQQQQQQNQGPPCGDWSNSSSSSSSAGPRSPHIANSGSSSSSMQELYSNPDARVYAVGYAARMLASEHQVWQLLHNTPSLVHGLQQTPEAWMCCFPHTISCSHCDEPCPMGGKGHCAACTRCGSAVCSLMFCAKCLAAGECCGPQFKVPGSHRWRLLDLLNPIQASLTAAVQDQKEQQRQEQEQEQGTDATCNTACHDAGLTTSRPCIPLALRNELHRVFTSWVTRQHQAVPGVLAEQQASCGPPSSSTSQEGGGSLLFEYQPRPDWGPAGSAAPSAKPAAHVQHMLRNLQDEFSMASSYRVVGRVAGGIRQQQERWFGRRLFDPTVPHSSRMHTHDASSPASSHTLGPTAAAAAAAAAAVEAAGFGRVAADFIWQYGGGLEKNSELELVGPVVVDIEAPLAKFGL